MPLPVPVILCFPHLPQRHVCLHHLARNTLSTTQLLYFLSLTLIYVTLHANVLNVSRIRHIEAEEHIESVRLMHIHCNLMCAYDKICYFVHRFTLRSCHICARVGCPLAVSSFASAHHRHLITIASPTSCVRFGLWRRHTVRRARYPR